MPAKKPLICLWLAGVALAWHALNAPCARADIACQVFGFADYEADGTMASMSMDGRWQRWAADATEPQSELETGVWLSCFWYGSSIGEVAPDGSYLAVMTDYGLTKVTPEGTEPLLASDFYYGDWQLAYTSDMRALLTASGDVVGAGFETHLFVESAPGANDFPTWHRLDTRCQNNPIMALAPVSDQRVAVVCSQGVLIMDIETGELYHSGVLGSLADDGLRAVDAFADEQGVVLYVLSADSGQPLDQEELVQLSHVRIGPDGATTVETLIDDLVGWRQPGDVAAIDGTRVAVRGDAGLLYLERDASGVWTSQLVAPEFDGQRVEATVAPTRILVSGWNVTEYTLGADGLWQSESFTPVGNPPIRTNSSICSAGGSGSGATLLLVLVAMVLPVRRRRTRAAR